MRRVSVVGNSGSGKSRLARELAAALDVPYVELDAIFHQPGWVPLPDAEFIARVEAAAAADGWVIDGNYSAVRPVVWRRADTVIWFDLPRRTVIRQVTLRTLRRAVTRAELWNGNREPWSNFLSRDSEKSIIAWAWTRHGVYRERWRTAAADPAFAHLRFVRVASRADARRVIAGVTAPRPPRPPRSPRPPRRRR